MVLVSIRLGPKCRLIVAEEHSFGSKVQEIAQVLESPSARKRNSLKQRCTSLESMHK